MRRVKVSVVTKARPPALLPPEALERVRGGMALGNPPPEQPPPPG